MKTRGARHLREADDGALHLAPVRSHQVGKFVHDNNKEGKRVVFSSVRVITLDIAASRGLQKVIPPFHFGDSPAEHADGFLAFHNDRAYQMREIFINGEFNALRVYENELQGCRRIFVNERKDKRMDHHRLSGPRCARDKQVGHLLNIRKKRFTGYVAPEHKAEGTRSGELRIRHQAPEAHERRRLVRHLNADKRLARDGRLDADGVRGKRKREVRMERGNAREFHALRGL